MSKVDNRYWFETKDFFNSTRRNSEKMIRLYFQLFFLLLLHHWELPLQIYQHWNKFQNKLISVNPEYPDFFVTYSYRKGFKIITGNKNPTDADENLSFSQQSTSSPRISVFLKFK